MPFRRTLSKEDHLTFDRIRACVKQLLQAGAWILPVTSEGACSSLVNPRCDMHDIEITREILYHDRLVNASHRHPFQEQTSLRKG